MHCRKIGGKAEIQKRGITNCTQEPVEGRKFRLMIDRANHPSTPLRMNGDGTQNQGYKTGAKYFIVLSDLMVYFFYS